MPAVASRDHRPILRPLHTDDASEESGATEAFLLAEPIARNVVLTILQHRVELPAPGRYWWVTDDVGAVGAVAVLSPLDYQAALVPVSGPPLDALVDAMHATVPTLGGVVGEAATAAAFAGRWADRSGRGAAGQQ